MCGLIKFHTVDIMMKGFMCLRCPEEEVKCLEALQKVRGAIKLPMNDVA